jgi:hypothetical protein
MGLLPPDHLHRSAHRIHLDLFAAVSPTQDIIEKSLDPALTHQIATAVAPLAELLLGDLAHIPEKVSGKTARWIDTLRLHLDNDSRELQPSLLHLRDFLQSEASAHAHGPKRIARHLTHGIEELCHRDVQEN